jgi:predicted nucleic acid-binding protein
MKVLFDTNVILDVLLNRDPFSRSAARLFSYVETGDLAGYVCATTITTTHYLAGRAVSRQASKEQVQNLLKLFDVTPVNRLVLEAALNLEMSDYEDAVLAASAHHAGMNALVTRDMRDFKNGPLPVHSPEQLLKILKP